MDNTNKNKLFEHYLKLKFVKKNKQLENNIDDLTVRIELLEEQILKLTNQMTDVLIDIERNGTYIDLEELETVRSTYENERTFRSAQNNFIV